MKRYDTKEIRGKFADALKNARLEVKNGTVNTVSISNGNVKMGAVPSVSTLPFITCPGRCNGTCSGICYAAKIANLRPSVLKAYARNTALLLDRPLKFWADVEKQIRGSRFFRFNVSGDILNNEYFENVVDIAAGNPHCDILIFTKQFEIVNTYIDKYGDLPQNLHVLFSGWENMPVDNPHNLPETNVFDKEVGPSDNWLVCGGNCFECGCRGVGCWQAKKGDIIAFPKH